jgi:hypothetical protein
MVIKERRQTMERKIEKGWKSIVCPDGKEKVTVMCEWEILSEMGRILKKTLKQIDCHNPKLTEFGGADCSWVCQKAIAKEKMTRSRMELLLVCAISVGGILWIVFYDIYLRPHLHLYGLLVFVGLPLLISLMLYYSWKMMSFSSKAQI